MEQQYSSAQGDEAAVADALAPQDITCSGGIRITLGGGNAPAAREDDGDDDQAE